MKANCSVIVLAGGNSERMSFPKSFLMIGGKTFLERICNQYLISGVKDIHVVMNKMFLSNKWSNYSDSIRSYVNFIENKQQELGRFHSIKLGAEKIKESDYCFVQNIDNPFVSEEIISLLWKNRIRNGFVSPSCKGISGQPVLISKEIIQSINSSLDGEINLRDILRNYEKNIIEVNNERILCNINTREDYEKYIQSYELNEL